MTSIILYLYINSQPLIKSDMLDMKKELKEVFLVPEIMKMTGFLDDINDLIDCLVEEDLLKLYKLIVN